MIEKLKNCPNCAGILDEEGRCKYCGSKVYDFLSIDFDVAACSGKKAKTYIRIRNNGKIMLLPVIQFVGVSINVRPDVVYAGDCMGNERAIVRQPPFVTVDMTCYCGNVISIEDKE